MVVVYIFFLIAFSALFSFMEDEEVTLLKCDIPTNLTSGVLNIVQITQPIFFSPFFFYFEQQSILRFLICLVISCSIMCKTVCLFKSCISCLKF